MKNKFISSKENIKKANVLITGGSGLIGKYLAKELKAKGYNVATVGRKSSKNTDNKYFWDIKNQEIEEGVVENADYIIHLAGAGIADKKWTSERKKEIIESRTKSAELLYNVVSSKKTKLKAFISASAVGYYGAITSETVFTENHLPATDFLGETCNLWEMSSDKFNNLGVRVVKLRTGIVLTKKGGAFEKMLKPIKMGIGSAIGSGKQFVPWIHICDLCEMYIKAIEDEKMSGAYNAVSSEYLTYREFAKITAQQLNKPFFFPNIPKFTLKLLFGEMAALLLEGSRISPNKILKKGFVFKYPDLKSAINNLLNS